MFISEIHVTCSLTLSKQLWQISFINLDYCLLLKNANDRLNLSISVYFFHAGTGLCTSFNKITYLKYAFNK